MVVPCAQLRVFVPLDTLPARDRSRWAPEGGVTLGLGEARQREDRVARTRLLTGRGSVPDDAVLVRRVGEERFVCPLQYDVRSAAALRQLRAEVPGPVVELLVPDRSLRDHLELVGAAGRVPTIVDAPFVVPLPWFVLFDDSERRLLDPPEGAGPRLVYLTTVGTALDRLGRAVDAVDDGLEDADELLEELADLATWLDEFDPRGLVELDYAGLSAVLGRGRLASDRSVHDVWAAIEGLEQGDLMAAVAYHGAIRARWGSFQALVSSS